MNTNVLKPKALRGLALVSAVALAGGWSVGFAQSTTHTDDFTVTAEVIANCLVDAGGALAFEQYDPIVDHASIPLDEAVTFDVTCTQGAPGVWIGLNLGANPDETTRRMADGENSLVYELYRETGRSTVWGNTSETGVALDEPTGVAQTVTVYGRIPAGQNVVYGSGYTDTITVTVDFSGG